MQSRASYPGANMEKNLSLSNCCLICYHLRGLGLGVSPSCPTFSKKMFWFENTPWFQVLPCKSRMISTDHLKENSAQDHNFLKEYYEKTKWGSKTSPRTAVFEKWILHYTGHRSTNYMLSQGWAGQFQGFAELHGSCQKEQFLFRFAKLP